MKGIILAGGSGTRLYPSTLVLSKQLLPVFDKPMIYYPLSTLMMAGIRDILIISTPQDLPNFEKLLGDGSCFGIKLDYKIQKNPDGIAQAFLIGKDFIGEDSCALILGDNIFHGAGLVSNLKEAIINAEEKNKATLFGYAVKDPKRFGVMEFDKDGNILSLEEKPSNPKSNFAVTGLYFYPSGVSLNAELIKPSSRGELEITDLNKQYLEQEKLKVILLGRGYSWLDTGTHDSLLEASSFIKNIEELQGIIVCCPEEIAFNNGWISRERLLSKANIMQNCTYGKHLLNVASGKIKF